MYGCHTPTDSCTGSQALLLRTPYNRYLRRQGALPCLLLRELLFGRALPPPPPTCRSNSFLLSGRKQIYFFIFSKKKKKKDSQVKKQNKPKPKQTKQNQTTNQTQNKTPPPKPKKAPQAQKSPPKQNKTNHKPPKSPTKPKKTPPPPPRAPPCLGACPGRLALPGRGWRGVPAPLGAGRASPAGFGHSAAGSGQPLSGGRCRPPLGKRGAGLPGLLGARLSRSPPVRRVWDLPRRAHPRRGGRTTKLPRGSPAEPGPDPLRSYPLAARGGRGPATAALHPCPPPRLRLQSGAGPLRRQDPTRQAQPGRRGPCPCAFCPLPALGVPATALPRGREDVGALAGEQQRWPGMGQAIKTRLRPGASSCRPRALPMAPRSDGDWPAGRLGIENGAINLSDFLAGRKVHLELWSMHELSLPTDGSVASAASRFLRPGVGAGRVSCSFTTCLASKEVSPNLFFNFL